MWHTLGILLFGAMDPSVVAADPYQGGPPATAVPPEMVGGPVYNQGPGMPGFQSGLMPGEQPMYAAEYAAMGNGPCYGPGASHTRPCSFDEYWDFTGQRSPNDYALWNGYGPDWCNTWNARVEWLMFFTPLQQPTLFVSTFDAAANVDLTNFTGQAVNPSRVGGENPISNNMRNGARITLGRYFSDSGVRAEGRFWGVEDGADTFAVTSLDIPRLAIPRINGFNGLDNFYFVGVPGAIVNGAVNISTKKDLYGADAWVRGNWWDDGVFRLDGLVGYQFLRLDDSVQIATTRTVIGTQVDTTLDRFIANNQFHGGSLGLAAEWRRQAIGLELLGKLGIGGVQQRVLIDGRSRTRENGVTTNSSNGLFTFPSNQGEYVNNRFCIVPELNANFVIHMTPGWRILAGYTMIYLNEVMMAADQIDPRVNTLQPNSGPPLPAYLGRDTTIFIQGINLGLDFRW